MKEVNYEMLKEDLHFPLKKDPGGYSIYIWDNKYNMVANYLDENSIDLVNEKVLGEMRTFDTVNDNFVLKNGVISSKANSSINVLLVRGWGRLKYKDDPVTRQENIANYLLNCLNS